MYVMMDIPYKAINISAELMSLSVILAILIYTLYDKRKEILVNSTFLLLLGSSVVLLLTDSFAWLFEGQEEMVPLMTTLRVVTYIANYFNLAIFPHYIIRILGIRSKVTRGISIAIDAMYLVVIVRKIVGAFYNLDFKYLGGYYNVVGDHDPFRQFFPLLIIVFCIVITIIYRKNAPKKVIVALFAYVAVVIGASILQLMFYMLHVSNYGTMVSILLLFVLINDSRREQLAKNEEELANAKIAVMMSQIRPHFLYNVLNSIAGLCEEDPIKAQEMTYDFADYLRANLDSLSSTELITFRTEIRHAETYLNLEKKRFEEKLNFEFDLKEQDFLIPTLTVQPIVENAVKHGVFKLNRMGTIKISTWAEGDRYYITVEDDGVGFDVNNVKVDPNRSHIGISNVKERLEKMCDGTLVTESTIGVGTKVTVTVPKTV